MNVDSIPSTHNTHTRFLASMKKHPKIDIRKTVLPLSLSDKSLVPPVSIVALIRDDIQPSTAFHRPFVRGRRNVFKIVILSDEGERGLRYVNIYCRREFGRCSPPLSRTRPACPLNIVPFFFSQLRARICRAERPSKINI